MLISRSQPPDFSNLLNRNLHLIFDVDGVVRNHTEMPIDERVLQAIKRLSEFPNVRITFISGTPVSQKEGLQIWRKSNSTLDTSLGKQFSKEIAEGKITIFGALGGHKLSNDNTKETLEEYNLATIFEMGKMLISAFLLEVSSGRNHPQIETAKMIKQNLDTLELTNFKQPNDVTPEEFEEIVNKIRAEIDPQFRLISYGTFIESHSSHPPWNTHHSVKYLKELLTDTNFKLSSLSVDEKIVGHGLAYRKNEGFNFLMISKTNKGKAINRYLMANPNRKEHEFFITIGDTQVDYPMHELSNLAFHVGMESVWKSHDLPHCHFVVGNNGEENQHVDGTLYLLSRILNTH